MKYAHHQQSICDKQNFDEEYCRSSSFGVGCKEILTCKLYQKLAKR